MTGKKRGVIRRQLVFFWKNYSRQILIGTIAIILIDLAELILPVLIKDTIDSFSQGQMLSHARDLLLKGLGVVVLLQVLGRYLWRVALSKSAMLAGAEFRKQFSDQSFNLMIPTLEKKKVGDLMTLATSDVENMRFALGPGLIALIDACFYCITLPLAMFWIAPGLALRVLVPVLCIPLVVYFLQGKIAIHSRKVQEQIGKLGTLTQEMISGVRIIKNFGLEKKITEKLKVESHLLNERQVELIQTQARMGPSMEFFLSTSIVLLFSIPGYSIGTLVAIQRYLQKLIWPLSASALAVVYFQKAKSSGEDFFAYIDHPEIEKGGSIHKHPEFKKDVPVVEARQLTFGYQGEKPVLQNLSFKIHSGEWVGFAGQVASGKSTLFQLLMKLYPVSRGQLFLNGIDINDYTFEAARHFFSPVLQDPYLFQGTLLENLQTSDEPHPLSWSMEVSGMQEEEFLHRLDQKLGERGTGLSGGQKQRVGIARALRKKSPVLLLDDPLSSVDLKTAVHVLKQIRNEAMRHHQSVLLISHHEEHLNYCDRVVQL